MVAPSCCLEYRPTIYFWLILIFIVFPSIYLAGKVIGCFFTVLFRISRALILFILWDSEETDDKVDAVGEKEKSEARSNRRKERRPEREREPLKPRKEIKASSTQTEIITSTQANYNKKMQPSDNSDSLISDDEISQTTNGTLPPEVYKGLTHRRPHSQKFIM